MKKMVLFVVCLNFVLLASEPNENRYTQALELYKNKQYQLAYDSFRSLNQKNIEDENINYYLGRSAFALKLFEEAISAYERILIANPKNFRAKLEMARCYFELQDHKQSKIVFEELLDEKLPKQVQENIQSYLAQIDRLQQRSFLSGAGIFGLVYDSNPASDPIADTIVVGGIPTTPNKSGEDFAHQEVLALTHIYDFGQIGGYKLKTDAIVFNKVLFEFSDKNVFFLSMSPKLSYQGERFESEAGFGFDRLWYGSESFMNVPFFFSKIIYSMSEHSKITSELKYQIKSNIPDANKDKNAKTLGYKIGYNKSFSPKLDGSLQGFFTHEKQYEGGFTPEIDYLEGGVQTGVQYKWKEECFLGATLEYRHIKYKDFNPLLNSNKREDKSYSAAITLLFPKLIEGIIVQGVTNFTRVDSNYPQNNYDKTTLTINFIKPF